MAGFSTLNFIFYIVTDVCAWFLYFAGFLWWLRLLWKKDI